MMFWLNDSSWSSMKLMRMGCIYRFRLTASDSPSAAVKRTASFSVVTMHLGDGIASNVSFSRRMSLRLKL